MAVLQHKDCFIGINGTKMRRKMKKSTEKRRLHRLRRNMPLEALLHFSRNIVDMEEACTYADYLQKNKQEIEKAILSTIILPVMEEDSFIIKELSGENCHNARILQAQMEGRRASGEVIQIRTRLFHGIKYLIFVPLPVFDKTMEKQTYTVLGSKWKMGRQTTSSIFMMLFSTYIYFKAQHERGEHQRMYFSMLSLMISVIDAKDPVTAGHSQRVAEISKNIGIWLKLNEKEQYDLEFTALIHDIGKIGVSDYVLNKPSVYTQNDFEQMKHHTVRGAEMLAEVGISQEIIDGVRHHHERIDGKGYPDGLSGGQLNLFAKIIKIADVFDALTSKGQYKEAWKIDKALDIIYKGRGTEFDTQIADVFIENMRPAGWKPPVDEKVKIVYKQDPLLKKAVNITNDFYHKYHDYMSVGYPIPSRKADKVVFESRNGFMNFDWGETFHNSAFLENKPVILSYEKKTESLLFGQCCGVDGVMDIYYYFFRGFINMGIFLLSSSKSSEILEQLQKLFGEPVEINQDTRVYIGKKYRIVYIHTYDDKELLCYVSDYMCSNYIYEEK